MRMLSAALLFAITLTAHAQAYPIKPIRVVVQSSATVAKRESITPELVSICPACSCLMIVAFFPAVAVARASA